MSTQAHAQRKTTSVAQSLRDERGRFTVNENSCISLKARQGKRKRQRRYLNKKNALKQTISSCFREFLEAIIIKTSPNESPECWLPGSSSDGPLIDLPQKVFSDCFLSVATSTFRHAIMRKVWAVLDSELENKRMSDRDLPRRRIGRVGKRQRCPVYLWCRFPNTDQRSEVEPLERFLLKHAAFLRVPVQEASRVCLSAFANSKICEDVPRIENPDSLLINGATSVAEDVFHVNDLYKQGSTEGKDEEAMYNVTVPLEDGASGVPKDPIRAKELFEQAISEGRDVIAMYNLALLLTHGASGVPKDPIRAKELYEQAISEGRDVMAMNNLASLLEDGASGVPKDPIRAKELYEQAIAEGQHVMAMYNLALLLTHGAIGVPKDPIRAKELFEQAISEGRDVMAMNNLALLLTHGASGVPKDPIRAKELYEQAISEGQHVMAMYNLALLLTHGASGVPKDPIRAKELFEQAISER